MLAFFVLLLMTLYYWHKYRNWSSPACLMSGLWTVVLFMYELNIIGLNKITTQSYLIICLGVFAFCVGTSISNKVVIVHGQQLYAHTDRDEYKYSVSYGALLLFAIVALLFYLPDALYSIRLLLAGENFILLRANVSETIITNSILKGIRNYVISPFIIFLYPISAYCLLSTQDETEYRTKRLKIWIFIVSATIAVLQLFTSGGRTTIVYLLAYVLVIRRLVKGKYNISRGVKRMIALAVVATVIGVYTISISRGISDVGRSMVLYLCGCVPLLDHYTGVIASTGTYTYGGAFFYGPLNLIFTLLGNIGFSEPSFMTYLTSQLFFENNVSIGAGININAFVSLFTYFFKDGGFITLLLESLIYGMFSQGFFKYATGSRNNIRKTIAYAIVTNTILFSMVRFQFIKYHYLLAFIYIFVFIKRDHISY